MRLMTMGVILVLTHSGTAQITNNNPRPGLKNLQEYILIEPVDDLFLSGETLYFSAYCFINDGNLSRISKVAYIDIVDTDFKAVLQTKISLKKGIGYGKIYLPSTLKSGNYTVIGYTRWMQNFSVSKISQFRIQIINPFDGDTFKNISEKGLGSPEIQFHPEGGFYNLGYDQKVVFKLTNSFASSSMLFKGKIINEDATTITEFSSSNEGYGQLNFIPERGQDYRVILTDEKNNSYIQSLPITPITSHSIYISEQEEAFVVKIIGVEDFDLNLEVTQKGRLIASLQIEDMEVDILKINIPPGIIDLSLKSTEGRLLSQRLIYNQPQISPIGLKTDKILYGFRERVNLSIEKINPSEAIDAVSISVRKKAFYESHNDIFTNYYFTSHIARPDKRLTLFLVQQSGFNEQTLNDLLITQVPINFSESPKFRLTYLPEIKGRLLSGKLVDANERPVANQAIQLSLPSHNFQLYSTKSSDSGNFHFVIDELYGENNLLVYANQITGNGNLEFHDSNITDYSFVHSVPFVFEANMIDWLSERSIEIQIENAYYNKKSDKEISPNTKSFISGIVNKTYYLDNYTQFKTMEETIREYVIGLSIKKSQTGNQIIMSTVFNKSGSIDTVLLMLNGIPIDADYLLQQDPKHFEKIELVKSQYKIGTIESQGIVNFQTYPDDFDKINLKSKFSTMTYNGLQKHFSLYQPNYKDNVELSRIPDYRNQIAWKPDINVKNFPFSFTFFTSDSPGVYIITISGITKSGNPFSSIHYFEVKK